MSKKNILADAIADAKAIKEAALANAKAAIAETFTPTLKSLISAELREELDEEGNSLPSELDLRNKATMENDGNEDDEIDETDGYKKSSKDPKQSQEKQNPRHGSKEEEPSMSKADREISELDALLRELESGESDDEEDKLDEKERNPFAEPDFNAVKNDQDKITPMDEKEEGGDDGEKASKDADYELYQQLKKKFEPKPNQKPKDEAKKEDGEGDEHDDEQGADDDFDIESIIRELEADGKEDHEEDEEDGYDHKVTEKKKNPFSQPDFNASKDHSDDIKPMDEKKFMAEINKIKKELNEVNLMNAKLLYFGKVIKEQDGLTKSEKVNFLKQFDKASTVKEAKLIYETITGSVKSNKAKNTKSQIKESLGFSSKAAGVAKTTKPTSVISEETVNRFRHLAGLSKSE